MKLKILASAVALSVAAFSGPASAITITNDDGTFDFTGFDWAQGGTAFTTGFAPVAGTPFSLTYFAQASALQNGVVPFIPPGMDISPNGVDNGYEYTIVANLNESVVGCVGTACTFDVLGGTFSIYYDTGADANALAGSNGTGFGNGALLLSGTVNPFLGQMFDTVQGFNVTALTGTITAQSALIDPALRRRPP